MLTILKIVPLSGKRDAVLGVLRSIESLLSGRAGCMDCAVFEQSGNEKAILYLDQWRTPEDLRLHIQSNLFHRLLLAMELGSRAPELSFYEVSDTRGLSWIQELRMKKIDLDEEHGLFRQR
ncbi:MAG: antibiotic biosynthesis monooxygenase [Acidobacteria bacterium]|nr:antibiotic biosynthesis monooxygenase [Acidobacteriota bacterium]